MHRGDDGTVRCWNRHCRRSGCADERAIRRGVCDDMLAVVARMGRAGDGQKFTLAKFDVKKHVPHISECRLDSMDALERIDNTGLDGQENFLRL